MTVDGVAGQLWSVDWASINNSVWRRKEEGSSVRASDKLKPQLTGRRFNCDDDKEE